ncbi:uncharacterized protein LOC135930411 isoform X2 [Gordionus sp. m RMFG-2023]|uniref:uncharacterized protein LOC135930411 isoform X2 n=1 Tax=Gordionus sp. m RMFG-2023 TaxID=3053472 RepID=UPI0031FC0F5B
MSFFFQVLDDDGKKISKDLGQVDDDAKNLQAALEGQQKEFEVLNKEKMTKQEEVDRIKKDNVKLIRDNVEMKKKVEAFKMKK